MTVNSLFKQAIKLSKPDQLKLAKKIQASAEKDGWLVDDITPAQKRMLLRRVEELKKHPERGIPWNDVVKKVEALRKAGK